MFGGDVECSAKIWGFFFRYHGARCSLHTKHTHKLLCRRQCTHKLQQLWQVKGNCGSYSGDAREVVLVQDACEILVNFLSNGYGARNHLRKTTNVAGTIVNCFNLYESSAYTQENLCIVFYQLISSEDHTFGSEVGDAGAVLEVLNCMCARNDHLNKLLTFSVPVIADVMDYYMANEGVLMRSCSVLRLVARMCED
jgi:hypothetical protein